MAERESGELDVKIALYREDETIANLDPAFVPACVPAK